MDKPIVGFSIKILFYRELFQRMQTPNPKHDFFEFSFNSLPSKIPLQNKFVCKNTTLCCVVIYMGLGY